MSTQINPILTVSDLGALPDDGNRYEIIEGELLVSRAPHLLHQAALTKLLIAINEYLGRNPIGKIFPGIGVILSDHDAVIPDVVFLTNDSFARIVSDGRLVAGPDLAIEILSPGPENVRRDRHLKRNLYGKYLVNEYWIVDLESKSVEQYLLAPVGLELVATFHRQDELKSALLPGLSLRVDSIFEV